MPQSDHPTPGTQPCQIWLPDADSTAALGRALAAIAQPGDSFLLEGAIGAGKSHLARAFIAARLAAEGRSEDIPSPTYTLVQPYDTEHGDILHADLYRLSDPDETIELGLEAAFESAICLVEWPDRLGALRPPAALTIRLTPDGGGRLAVLDAAGAWPTRLAPVLKGCFP